MVAGQQQQSSKRFLFPSAWGGFASDHILMTGLLFGYVDQQFFQAFAVEEVFAGLRVAGSRLVDYLGISSRPC